MTNKQHPHRSTTVPERFFHINDGERRGTVFFRKDPKEGHWTASVALCHPNDQFCKRTGRNVARRKWFLKPDMRGAIAGRYEEDWVPDFASAELFFEIESAMVESRA